MVDCKELQLDKHRQANVTSQKQLLVKHHSVTEDIRVANNEKFVETQVFKTQ